MPVLVNNEDRDFNQYFSFNYQQLKDPTFLSNLGATNEKIIGYVQPGGAVNIACIYVGTTPVGATDLVFSAGVTAATPTEFINLADLDALVAADYNSGSALSNTSNLRLYVNNTTSPVPIYMRVTGTLANLTAGSWIVAWHSFNPRRFFVQGN